MDLYLPWYKFFSLNIWIRFVSFSIVTALLLRQFSIFLLQSFLLLWSCPSVGVGAALGCTYLCRALETDYGFVEHFVPTVTQTRGAARPEDGKYWTLKVLLVSELRRTRSGCSGTSRLWGTSALTRTRKWNWTDCGLLETVWNQQKGNMSIKNVTRAVKILTSGINATLK